MKPVIAVLVALCTFSAALAAAQESELPVNDSVSVEEPSAPEPEPEPEAPPAPLPPSRQLEQGPGRLPDPPASAAPTPHVAAEAGEAHAIVGGVDVSDPTMSMPVPGMLPELAPPAVDLIAANFSVSTSGTRVTGSISPFRFIQEDLSFLTQTSIRLTGDSGSRTWGAGITMGYNSGRSELYRIARDPARQSAVCEPRFGAAVAILNQALRELLTARGIAPPTRSPGTTATAHTVDLIDAAPEGERSRYQRDLRRLQDERAECLASAYRAFAVEDAFGHGRFSVNVSAAANLFAIVDEPAVIDPTTMTPTDPTSEILRDWSVTLSGAYFFTSHIALWFTSAFSRQRADAGSAGLDSRLGFGATLAGFHPIAPATANGFRPGLAFGLGATYTRCLEQQSTMGAACREKLDGYPSALRISEAFQALPFFDVRIDSKLQLRLGVTIDVFRLDQAVAGTEAMGGDTVLRIVPMLSATTSEWSF